MRRCHPQQRRFHKKRFYFIIWEQVDLNALTAWRLCFRFLACSHGDMTHPSRTHQGDITVRLLEYLGLSVGDSITALRSRSMHIVTGGGLSRAELCPLVVRFASSPSRPLVRSVCPPSLVCHLILESRAPFTSLSLSLASPPVACHCAQLSQIISAMMAMTVAI